MKDLKYNKHGKIVSKKVSSRAKKEKRLHKAGFKTRKGVFELFRKQYGGSNAIARQPTFRPINTTPPSHLTQPALLFPMVEGYTPEEILRNRDTIIQLFFGGLYIKAVQKYLTGKGKELQVHKWDISDFNNAMRLLKTKNTDMERIIRAGIDKLMKRTLDIYETPAQLDVIIDTAMKSAQRQFDGTSGVKDISRGIAAKFNKKTAAAARDQVARENQARQYSDFMRYEGISGIKMARAIHNRKQSTQNKFMKTSSYINKEKEMRTELETSLQSLRMRGVNERDSVFLAAKTKLANFKSSPYNIVMAALESEPPHANTQNISNSG